MKNKKVKSLGMGKALISGNQKGAALMWILIMLLLLAALGVMGYLINEQNQNLEELQTQQAQYIQEGRLQRERLDTFVQQIQALQTENQDLQAQLDQMGREAAAIRLGISDGGDGISHMLAVAETTALVRLARQHLLTGNITAATGLFASANQLLQTVDNPAIIAVRGMLAADLAALRATQVVDVNGLYGRLTTVANQVDTIALEIGFIPEEPASAAGNDQEASTPGLVSGILEKLGQYFIVRRINDPIQPLLTTDQADTLRRQLQLLLEQAKLALLQSRPDSYGQSLEAAAGLVDRYVASGETQKQEILASLEALRQENIVVPIPELSDSLSILEGLVDSGRAVR